MFARVVRWVLRRPVQVIAITCLLAAAGAVLGLRLDVSADVDTLVDRDSPAFEATARYKQNFGEDPIAVLVQGDLRRTVLTPDLGRLVLLEQCLAGTIPPVARAGAPTACRELAEMKAVKAVYGPGTFIDTSVTELRKGFMQQQRQAETAAGQAGEQSAEAARRRGASKAAQRRAGEAARREGLAEFDRLVLGLGLKYGLTSVPAIDNPDFVSRLVFQPGPGVPVPKARFAPLFPNSNAAVVQVRLRSGLAAAERSRAAEMVERAVAHPDFRLGEGTRYVVTGAPVLVEALGEEVKRSALILLVAALIVMAGTLALVFRTRLRLLPLAVAIGAAALTFGAVSLVGGSLTVASIAALPVLIGLAVDYAIQLQARFDEARGGPEVGARDGEGTRPAASAAEIAARAGAPTIASAAVATIAGFLVLLLSPTPMIRGFALIVVLGIVLAFACALTAGFAALSLWSDRSGRPLDVPPPLPRLRTAVRRVGSRLAATPPARPVGDAARRLAPGGRPDRGALAALAGRPVAYVVEQRRRVLLAGMLLAVVGWAASTQHEVVSDVRALVPQDVPALKNSATFERETGVAGEIDIVVRSDRLTEPAIVAWMSKLREGVLAANGYRPEQGCGRGSSARLCPAFSLPELFRGAGSIDRAYVEEVLDAVPPYVSRSVVSADRQTASLAFGIPLLPLAEQKQVVEGIERRLEERPPGVAAEVVGLPVLAAEASDELSSPIQRFLLLAVGLVAVFLVLLVQRRHVGRAAVPLIPIGLATGWSALVLFALRIPLNPLSASLGALVLAISTEFAVLLSARYEEERARGASPARAVELTYSSTGAAVVASGVTAIAGFAALVASDLRVLRDFGAVTVVDLAVSLAGVMLVLPAALVWAEARGPISWRALDPRRRGSTRAGGTAERQSPASTSGR